MTRAARTFDLGLLLAAIAAGACGSLRGGGAADARRYRDAPGVVLTDLTAAEQTQFFAEFNELPCPCGAAHSLGSCVHDHAACHLGARATAYLVRLVRDGYPDDEIADRFRQRFGRLASDVRIAVDPSALEGPAEAPVTVTEFADFQ